MDAGELATTVAAGTAVVGVAGGSLSATFSAFSRALARERHELTEELLSELPVVAEPVTQEENYSAKFTKLLIRYYSYGLTQARASFYVSLAASILGGLVLIIGVGLAVFHANTIGDQYASIVASVAGVLTGGIGALFHRRADSALRHMESQTTGLRQDMKRERDIAQAIELLETMDKVGPLEARLRAALILKFTSSELPDLGGPGEDQPRT